MLLNKGLHHIFLTNLFLIGSDTTKGCHKNLGSRGVAIMRPIVLPGRIRRITRIASPRGKGPLTLEELLHKIPHLPHHSIDDVLVGSNQSKAVFIKEARSGNAPINKLSTYLSALLCIERRENSCDSIRRLGHALLRSSVTVNFSKAPRPF